nr:hypothetical protein [uncultured Dyadobacter sp.]
MTGYTKRGGCQIRFALIWLNENLYSKVFSADTGSGVDRANPNTIGGIFTVAQQVQMQKGEQKSPGTSL